MGLFNRLKLWGTTLQVVYPMPWTILDSSGWFAIGSTEKRNATRGSPGASGQPYLWGWWSESDGAGGRRTGRLGIIGPRGFPTELSSLKGTSLHGRIQSPHFNHFHHRTRTVLLHLKRWCNRTGQMRLPSSNCWREGFMEISWNFKPLEWNQQLLTCRYRISLGKTQICLAFFSNASIRVGSHSHVRTQRPSAKVGDWW